MTAYAFPYVQMPNELIVMVMIPDKDPVQLHIKSLDAISAILKKFAMKYKITEIVYVPEKPWQHAGVWPLLLAYEEKYQGHKLFPERQGSGHSRYGVSSSEGRRSDPPSAEPGASGFDIFREWRGRNNSLKD